MHVDMQHTPQDLATEPLVIFFRFFYNHNTDNHNGIIMKKSIFISALALFTLFAITVFIVSQYGGMFSDAGIQFTNIQHFN